MALSMFGAEHAPFGTEIPFREDIDLQLQDLEALNLSAADRQAIDAGNPARLLGIPLQLKKGFWHLLFIRCRRR